jgi:serine/threonine protein kinase
MSLPSLTDHEELEALMGQVLDEYAERLARGKQPDPDDYARRYPQLAAVLRLTLPALEVVRPAFTEDASKSSVGIAPEAEGQLGDYRIIRPIGRGGMGIVYEAIQTSLGRRVALKVLPFAGALDAKQLQRFRNEAQAAARLHHTNIVPVFGVGCERGVHYYAMQYIEGRTLAAVIRELKRNLEGRMTNAERRPNAQCPSPNDPAPGAAALTDPRHSTLDILSSFGIGHSSFFRTVAQLGSQAAKALEHAHEEGVVHRDIKPANLLVDAKGKIWITDFGLAHCQGTGNLTLTGDLVGTVRYMSPEQALAKRGLVDHRTDIYSLGVTLYELLTLEPAYSSNDREELLRQIAYEEPRAPRRLNKPIPAELETIVLKAMEKSPEDRYSSAQELAEDLEHFLQNKPIRARPARWWERAWKWARRRPALTAVYLLLLLTLILSGLGAGAAGLWQRAEAARLDAVAARDQTQVALQQEKHALAREAEARHHLAVVSYLHKIELAHHALKDGDLVRAQLLLDQCPAELRHWEWYYVHHLCHREMLTLQGLTEPVVSIVYSPDGRRMISRGSQSVQVWDVATNREIFTLPARERETLVISPDCKHFACCLPGDYDEEGTVGESELKVGDLATGKERFKIKVPGSRVAGALFSPDGKQLLALSNEGEPRPGGLTLRGAMKVWDLATRQVTATFQIDGACFMGAAFSGDGKYLAAHSCVRKVPVTAIVPHEIKVWDLMTGQGILTFKSHALGGGYAFSPDGKRIASGSQGGTLKIWDVLTGEEALTLRPGGASGGATCLAFSPDGRQLAAALGDGTVKVWTAPSFPGKRVSP